MPTSDVAARPPRAAGRGRALDLCTRRFAGAAAHARLLSRPLLVAHLSDLHVGRVTPIAVQLEAVRLARAARPDLVVVTGDFVCHSLRWLDELADVISALSAPNANGAASAPVVCVLGNHDHASGADAVTRTLERAGALVLRNASTLLDLGGERLQVVGVDDAFTRHADVARATYGLRRDVATLGLSHIGEVADALWARGVPLVLSGHTHAGQVSIGRLPELVVAGIAGHRYIHGLYGSRADDRAVYVSAGVGASFIPVRVGPRAQREVTFFELGAAPGAFGDAAAEQRPAPSLWRRA